MTDPPTPEQGSPGDGREGMRALLASAGIEEAAIVAAQGLGHLELLAIERLVLPDPPKHDLGEVAEATGLAPGAIKQMWRSLGFVEPRRGDHLFTDVDVEMLATIGRFIDMGLIDDDLTVQMARVIGSSLSRIAAALIDAVDPSDPGVVLPSGEQFAEALPLLLPALLQVMDYVWRRHVQVEARARMSREQGSVGPDQRAVGFADLVGFTALSQQVTSHELAAVVGRFEGIAYDTVGALGGRVVKMIGDEVMFAVPDERAAAEIALTLAETYRDDDELSDVRVGLAAGAVLQRDADLFGPVVNRASRIVNIAFPGTVLCATEIADALADDPAFSWKPIGTRNLKGIGKLPLVVLRRADAPEPVRTSRRDADSRRASRRDHRVDELSESRRTTRGDGDGEPVT